MDEFGLVILGAALSFVGALVGSIFVTRLGLRRERRLNIYDNLLPVLRDASLVESLDYVGAVIEDIRRAAVILSPTERRLADQLRNRACDYKSAQREESRSDGKGGFLPPPEGGQSERAAEDLVALRDSLDAVLADKLRGGWPR